MKCTHTTAYKVHSIIHFAQRVNVACNKKMKKSEAAATMAAGQGQQGERALVPFNPFQFTSFRSARDLSSLNHVFSAE